MKCAICGLAPTGVGILCGECHEELPAPANVAPEQVVGTPARGGPALVDRWGRPHALRARSTIGRAHEGLQLAVLDGRISRHHAELSGVAERGADWTVRDLGSANGTFVNDAVVGADPVALRRGDKLVVGHVGFFFLDFADKLPAVALDPAAAATLRTGDAAPLGRPHGADFAHEEHTDAGLYEVTLRLHEPTDGGGGVLEIDGRRLQLTATQFEFVALLAARMRAEPHQPALVRGFVRTSELIGALSWDTHEPGDNHLKQLVRRVRRAMVKADLGDLIESRHRFGYRLRVVPRATADA